MNETQPKPRPLLSLISLGDEYERRARLLPGVLTIAFLIPGAAAVGMPLGQWLTLVIAGTGLGAVFAVGISHLASAMGNRFQRILWPRWPHDSPTNTWLHPDDSTRSKQQKEQWNAAILRLTGLDIPKAARKGNPSELEAVINDAFSQVRARLWKSPTADRLRTHNADYGFARNFSGLRPVWLTCAVLGCLTCWITYFVLKGSIVWSVASTLILGAAFLLACVVLPPFVRQKANQYAESFFDALLALDRVQQQSALE